MLRGVLVAAGLAVAFSAGALRGPVRANESRSLSFVGKLSKNGQPVVDSQAASFRFKKNGVEACAAVSLMLAPDSSGSFQVNIPLATCPQSLFNGAPVVFDLVVGGEVAMSDQPVGFVPQARYADQVGYSECPLDYERDPGVTAFVVCKRGNDAVVRVGKGATSFWIDRYEASVCDQPDGAGRHFDDGIGGNGYPVPRNGQIGASDNAYAASVAAVRPTTNISWLQADAACRASGKRLPTSAEWGAAERGTADPGENDGSFGACNTMTIGVRNTAQSVSCASMWGAEDMIGNVDEWISEWFAAPVLASADHGKSVFPWDDGTGDATVNLSSGAASSTAFVFGLPAGLLRGGYSQGTGAGALALNLSVAPHHGFKFSGFRCMIPR
jgi:formylglycine-generating enzyme required for sulfatase activity